MSKQPSLLEKSEWDTLLDSIHGRIVQGNWMNWCTPILGPEVCPGTLTLRRKLARKLAEEPPPYPRKNSYDLIQVTQYLTVMSPNLQSMYQSFAKQFRAMLSAPGGPGATTRSHDILAQLPISLYATTNLDTLMMAALKKLPDKEPREELYVWGPRVADLKPVSYLRDPSFRLHPAMPIVYYLFGNVDEPLSMVLSEDDHLDFLAQVASAPVTQSGPVGRRPSEVWDESVLTNKFVTKLRDDYLLFLGYRLEDFDLRILLRSLKSILARSSSQRIPLIAVQLEAHPSDGRLKKYLESFCQRHKIQVFWGACSEFIEELGERYADFAKAAPVAAGIRS
jgi:hypothetical protein